MRGFPFIALTPQNRLLIRTQEGQNNCPLPCFKASPLTQNALIPTIMVGQKLVEKESNKKKRQGKKSCEQFEILGKKLSFKSQLKPSVDIFSVGFGTPVFPHTNSVPHTLGSTAQYCVKPKVGAFFFFVFLRNNCLHEIMKRFFFYIHQCCPLASDLTLNTCKFVF